MSTATARRLTRTHWSARGVSVGQVVDQLARQRRPSDGGAPSTLAAVLNLVAYAPGPGALDEMQRVIERLADHQPSRAVLLVESEEGEGIDASITTSCREAGEDTTIAVEVIVLTVHGAARAGDASAAVPLLRADLPTVLWWPGPPGGGPGGTLARLATLADRVITETGQGDTAAGLESLARWARADGPAITDLAWAAITPWRQLLAQILDPAALERLRTAAAVASIAHPAPHPTVEALLMAGWLLDVIGPHMMVELHPRPGPEHALLAVELEGSVSRRRLSVERLPGRGAAAVVVSEPGGATRRRVLPLPSPDRARLLAGELELQRRDRAFERALARAAGVVA